ncbi:MAG: aldolase [Actinobacteria bacterium]|nr:aldolase [Actinomycetota bacterium]
MSSLSKDFFKEASKYLAEVDTTLAERYPGDFGGRQPIHTCYVPADKFSTRTIHEWGEHARNALSAHANSAAEFAGVIGVKEEVAADWWPRLQEKLTSEPIEDLRIDFEDGYGRRSDIEEDDHVTSALASMQSLTTAFSGIRMKSLEAVTRDRALRTLDQFITGLVKQGGVPENFVVTLPKVTFVEQVEVMVKACEDLEHSLKLKAGTIRFEIQIETTQAIVSPKGKVSAALMIDAAQGRLTAFHYGTYDYSAAAGISAAYQTLDHPAADFAKSLLQVVAAGTGVRLSDGSTNIIPIGERDSVRAAWANHYRLVRRSLERGFYQGWDLHGAQIPTRIAANFTFYREGLAAASQRLRTYLDKAESGTMDEPATALALAGYFLRGLDSGAITSAEMFSLTGQSEEALRALVKRRGQLN